MTNWQSVGGRHERVVIGILTWNGYELARACLASLSRLDGWPIPVVVVDNGSREPDGERLAMEFGPPVEAITLPQNQLVAGGYNALIRAAAERGASHVLLLNDDTTITDPAMLDRLVAAADPAVAAVGPLVLNDDGSLFSAGGTLEPWTGRSGHLEGHQMPARDRPYEVSWIDGPCMLVSIAAACRIGGLDPAFGATWEDVDWCVRAGGLGYRCLVEPRTTIRHLRGQTIPAHESELHLLRNRILFARRHADWPHTITAAIWFMLATVPRQAMRSVSSLAELRRIASATWAAVRWNLADAKRRGSWHRPATGPEVCGPGRNGGEHSTPAQSSI